MGATYVTVTIRNPAEPDRMPGEDEPFSGIWATRKSPAAEVRPAEIS